MVLYHIGVVQLLWEKKKTCHGDGKKRRTEDMVVTLVTLRASTVTLPNPREKIIPCRSYRQKHRLVNFLHNLYQNNTINKETGSCHELCNPPHFHQQLKQQQFNLYLGSIFGKCGPNETVLSSSVTKLGDMSQQPLCL